MDIPHHSLPENFTGDRDTLEHLLHEEGYLNALQDRLATSPDLKEKIEAILKDWEEAIDKREELLETDGSACLRALCLLNAPSSNYQLTLKLIGEAGAHRNSPTWKSAALEVMDNAVHHHQQEVLSWLAFEPTAFLLACENNDLEAVEALLKGGVNPLLSGPDGRTAWDIAAENGFYDLQLWLEDRTPEQTDKNVRQLLARGHEGTVRGLLARHPKALDNLFEGFCKTRRAYPSLVGNLEIYLQKLLGMGWKPCDDPWDQFVNLVEEQFHETAAATLRENRDWDLSIREDLSWLCQHNAAPVVRELLQSDIEQLVTNEGDLNTFFTCLQNAVDDRRWEVVKTFLESPITAEFAIQLDRAGGGTLRLRPALQNALERILTVRGDVVTLTCLDNIERINREILAHPAARGVVTFLKNLTFETFDHSLYVYHQPQALEAIQLLSKLEPRIFLTSSLSPYRAPVLLQMTVEDDCPMVARFILHQITVEAKGDVIPALELLSSLQEWWNSGAIKEGTATISVEMSEACLDAAGAAINTLLPTDPELAMIYANALFFIPNDFGSTTLHTFAYQGNWVLFHDTLDLLDKLLGDDRVPAERKRLAITNVAAADTNGERIEDSLLDWGADAQLHAYYEVCNKHRIPFSSFAHRSPKQLARKVFSEGMSQTAKILFERRILHDMVFYSNGNDLDEEMLVLAMKNCPDLKDTNTMGWMVISLSDEEFQRCLEKLPDITILAAQATEKQRQLIPPYLLTLQGYEINTSSFKDSTPPLPPPPDFPLEKFYDLVDEINFSRKEEPSYIDPQTVILKDIPINLSEEDPVTKLKEAFAEEFKRMRENLPDQYGGAFGGTTEERKEHHEKVKEMLQRIGASLANLQDPQERAEKLISLADTLCWCETGLAGRLQIFYGLTSNRPGYAQSLRDTCNEAFKKFRGSQLNIMITNLPLVGHAELVSLHAGGLNAHIRHFFVRKLGDQLALPEMELLFEDKFEPEDLEEHYPQEKLENHLYRAWITPKKLLEHFDALINPPKGVKIEISHDAIQEELKPPGLSSAERYAFYQSLYNEDFTRIKPEATIELLERFGYIKKKTVV